jgi:excisionase family DNA binding protein
MAIAARHTVLPPADPAEVDELAALETLVQRSQSAYLLGADGTRVALPPAVIEVLLKVVRAMHAGRAITVAPHELRLSTQQAGELLGISRPTLVKLLEEGRIPFEQPGRHRRVRLQDLLDYRERRRRERRTALADMVQETEDLGLYELPDDAHT